MKGIVLALKNHIKEDYNPWMYEYFVVFLCITIGINYQLEFEDTVLDGTYSGKPLRYLFYFLFYAFVYFAIAIPKAYISKNYFFRKKEFWIKSLFFIALLTASASFYHYRSFFDGLDPYQIYFIENISVNLKGVTLIIIPLILFKLFYDRKQKDLYGINFKKHNYWPYIIMLLLMLPLILWASTQADFLETYPTFKPWLIPENVDIFGLNNNQMFSTYETLYTLDFISTELIFRGAFVIGMVSVMGKDCLLPMVATYAFLHFGKPIGETIGSIFGGYILGVIALHYKNIIGGCIVHVGIALMMDLVAYYVYLSSQ